MSALRFGVNYTPSEHWFHSWLEPSWDAVRRDMESIARLGLDHVRIFPLWPLLQPNRAWIRPRALADVRTMADIAHDHGLDVSVDVIQGHLSSFDFLPSWMTSWHHRNMFTDPDALEGQTNLVRALYDALADAPGFLGLTMGNELNQFSDRPHPTPMRATSDEAAHWVSTLLAAAPSAPSHGRVHEHVHAAYDAVWYLDDHPFLPAHASRLGDMTAIHSWVFNGTAQHYGGMSQQSVRHAEYLVELSRAFATDPARRVWLQEVGAPLNCLAETDTPAFCADTVRAAADTTGLWGVTWWCSHDVSRRLTDFPELEYSLGLFDEARRPKPIALRFAETARELRARAHPPVHRTLAVEVPVDTEDVPLSRSALAPGGVIFEEWMRLAAQDLRPALVTSATVADPAGLAARGIRDVVRVPLPSDPASAYAAVSDG
ncbi:glycoside hydrolase 5 family protein [Streptomyces acidicola]|uniref:glycoside hydrolase 5 family protein n=1 Tax=Streptomyces acidicola TaxID=2596892 RepID=UPI00341B4B44